MQQKQHFLQEIIWIGTDEPDDKPKGYCLIIELDSDYQLTGNFMTVRIFFNIRYLPSGRYHLILN